MPAIRELRCAALALLVCAACGGGTSTSVPADPAPVSDALERGDPTPGVRVRILEVFGGSGAGESFRAGDFVSVHFSLEKSDGSPWGLAELDFGSILVSGPTYDYQRVIAEQRDLIARSTKLGASTYLYTFATPLPARYLAPYNDTPAFGRNDGELTDLPLLDGTYTVGLTLAWRYTIGASEHHDVGETVAHFPVGGATTIVPREVTSQTNCNACHVDLRAHQGLRRDIRVCVLCHTAGAEDLNDPSLAGGTPETSISSRILFHRIHNGKHLPSVLGVTTDVNGLRDYTATPKPFVVVDGASGVHDYSRVGFPVWPNRTIPMPADLGFDGLSAEAQARELEVRRGVTQCRVCHGDPDGAGPLAAPSQGDTVYAQPSRAACGACHDDVIWSRPYDAGLFSVMPPQPNDATCRSCHFPDDELVPSISVRSAHVHPLDNPQQNPFVAPGFHLALTGVGEGTNANGDGTLDAGERVALSLEFTNDLGQPVAPASLGSITAVISGPSRSANLVLETTIPRELLVGEQPFSIQLPERRELEFVGRSSSASGESFTTLGAPHHTSGATLRTQVRAAIPSGAPTTLAEAAGFAQNELTLADASGFTAGDELSIDAGILGQEEYLRVQRVEGARVWFASPHTPGFVPGTRVSHSAGAVVQRVSTTLLAEGVAYALDRATGTITELGELGDGVALLATYTTDFVVPTRYPVAANASPDLGEAAGKWSGKALVDGTYRLSVSATMPFDYFLPSQLTHYVASSEPASVEFLVGGASTLEPYDSISPGSTSIGANCYACHQELEYHTNVAAGASGNFRGFETCIACHANSGAEDRPQYVTQDGPSTRGVSVAFRTLLHQIHRGSALTQPLEVIGEPESGSLQAWSSHTYDAILFPAEPRRSAECAKCHGANNGAWKEPRTRDHPTEQLAPSQIWRQTCGACHDKPSSTAHIASNTAPDGGEACETCHGVDREWNVALYHELR